MNPIQQAELAELARLGVSTIYEAQGRVGLIDLPLIQIIPASRVAGRVCAIGCAQGDNLMVHAAMALVQPGDVLLLAMPIPEPIALLGELLALQAHARGVAGIVLNGAVRDVEALRVLGLPIWAPYIRARGAARIAPGSFDQPINIGSTWVTSGDLALLDADGAVVIAANQLQPTLAAARQRVTREDDMRTRFAAGELSIEIYGLREQAQLPPR